MLIVSQRGLSPLRIVLSCSYTAVCGERADVGVQLEELCKVSLIYLLFVSNVTCVFWLASDAASLFLVPIRVAILTSASRIDNQFFLYATLFSSSSKKSG